MPPLAASIFFHAIGATAAACCYVPQKRVKGWSWQSYWLTQAAFCWLLLPILGAFLTVPEFWQVVQAAPHEAMLRSFLLGAAYGIGGTAFGVAIRYVGFSVTYAMAPSASRPWWARLTPSPRGTAASCIPPRTSRCFSPGPARCGS